jgi:hypothetical protein
LLDSHDGRHPAINIWRKRRTYKKSDLSKLMPWKLRSFRSQDAKMHERKQVQIEREIQKELACSHETGKLKQRPGGVPEAGSWCWSSSTRMQRRSWVFLGLGWELI